MKNYILPICCKSLQSIQTIQQSIICQHRIYSSYYEISIVSKKLLDREKKRKLFDIIHCKIQIILIINYPTFSNIPIKFVSTTRIRDQTQ